MLRAVLPLLAVGACATSSGRVQTAVVFTRYSPLSSNREVARRVLPPLARHAMERELAASNRALAEQAIDLASEKYHALDALEAKRPVDADELERCNARLDAAIAVDLRKAEVAIAHGEREAARALLEAIDARFGGLAAPRLVELADRLTPPR